MNTTFYNAILITVEETSLKTKHPRNFPEKTNRNQKRKQLHKTPARHRDIFRDTLNAKKNYGEGEDRTHDLLDGKAISEVHFTPWSGYKVEFCQNLFKNITDHDFPPPLMWAENNKISPEELSITNGTK